MPTPRLHLLDLPSEIRAEIWRYLVSTRCNKIDKGDGYASYAPCLRILQVNRAISAEATEVYRRSNVFCKIFTPWDTTRDYIYNSGRVPIVAEQCAAQLFAHYHLNIELDVPDMSFPNMGSSVGVRGYIVISADDLPAFCRLWWYTELTHDVMNKHLRLRLTVRNPNPATGKLSPEPLSRAIQLSLLDPFTNVKRLAQIVVKGSVDTAVKESFMERIKLPYESPEECLERATELKNKGNDALRRNQCRDAVQLYEQSFSAMFIIVNGRNRDEWGDAHFDKRLITGAFSNQPGNYVRLLLRIELTANTILAYHKLGEYDLARFWGMRSIELARARFGESVDFADLEFDGAGYWGRVYFGTSLACRELGLIAEAHELYQIARNKLPNDDDITHEAPAFARLNAS